MRKREVVERKLAQATTRLRQAEELLARSREEFVADMQGRDLAAFYLFLSIQESIDLAAHWVADAGWPPPDEAGATFDLLADHGVIDRETASAMRSAVGLRNRIGHGYSLLDHGRLHDESGPGIAGLRAFLARVARALDG